ncbi:hypothetical protein PsorP6_010851 [Peronosclerospora sorghi]|uniref:Uncharacterized protein n=1 Tax=Peronosclerospora sorghi TaxID=230839 RepID=A0ACC0VW30_9STRA|nr:hypothetical protein PsorP6_010851 [Peronosclerospora sorghi]
MKHVKRNAWLGIMAAFRADRMETEMAPDEATSRPAHPSSYPEKRNWRLETEQKRRYPVRVRTVRLTTRVHPDMLVPYLYGERGGRCMNAIVNATGCTIDYCALSPEEDPDRCPDARGFVLNFLVSADSSAMLDEATRELTRLVERVQLFLQKKARGSRKTGRESVEEAYSPQYYRAPRSGSRWMDRVEEVSYYDARPRQRMQYAPGAPRLRRKRPRYMQVMESEADGTCHFGTTQGPGRRRNEYEQDPATPERHRAFNHVFTRRARDYPQHAPWDPRHESNQMRGQVRYPKHAAARGNGHAMRMARTREPHYSYHVVPQRHAISPYSWYECEDASDEDTADFFPYDETTDLRHENMETVDVVNQLDPHHEPLHQSHSRPSLKRPLSRQSRRSRMYRLSSPPIPDYIDDDEDDEWLSEEEKEVAHDYVYTSYSYPATIPFGRVRPRSHSGSAHRWAPVDSFEPEPMHQRRRFSRERIPVSKERVNDTTFEMHERGSASSSRSDLHTVDVDHHEADTNNTDMSASSHHTSIVADNFLDENSAPLNPSEDQAGSPNFNVVDNEELYRTANSTLEGSINSTTRETLTEQDVGANHDELQSTSDTRTLEELSVGYISPSEQAASDLNTPADHKAGSERANTPNDSMLSPMTTRESPESRVASPLSPFEKDTNQSMDFAAEECPDNAVVPEIASENVIEKDCNANEDICFHPTAETGDNENVRISNQAIVSLKRLNKVEADFMRAKSSLAAQKDKLRQVHRTNKRHRRLEILCDVVYRLQCQVSATSCRLDVSCRQELLARLDTYVDKLLIPNGQPLQEQIDALASVVEDALTKDSRYTKHQDGLKTKTLRSNSPLMAVDDRTNDEADEMNWEHNEWRESGLEDGAISCEAASIESESFAKNREEGSLACRPREMPPFIWSLLDRVLSCDPQSYVMRDTQKRVVDEIVKGDAYYYLHTTIVSDVRSPLETVSSSGCEFGCHSASALQLERKLVAQISSRMKSFDMVAYSLARTNKGKEVLNRKKMNSIIRKLHLVAVQLHALISHLYCVKGYRNCKEVDSLPNSLNRAQFERKQSVYKSRLKLVEPSNSRVLDSSNDDVEALYRETYEFFPELLVCVDIWGYNYRESLAKQHVSTSVVDDTVTDSWIWSDRPLFPLSFFREVETLSFDYEHDKNGLLRCICDELLNIVCLWNDFKWSANFEAKPIDQIMSFESDVTASILKIVELYAHHLEALWAIRFLDTPAGLRDVHFTQLNAYYSDRSQASVPPSRTEDVERMEQCLAAEYWNGKIMALSMECDRMETEEDATMHKVLRPETMCAWTEETVGASLLRWSEVYSMRRDVNALASVTNHMIKHEIRKIKLVNAPECDMLTRQLLAAGSRAQMLVQDALNASEKLALHSAAVQLPMEKKQVERGLPTEGEARGEHDALAMDIADKSAQVGEQEGEKSPGMHAEQLELKDLIQLVAVTKREMQELCSQRPRSRRMREKVQTQSLQLARQTVEMFRNIRIMYTDN